MQQRVSDPQPEMAVWPPKPEIFISLELRDLASKLTTNPRFSATKSRVKVSASCDDDENRKWQDYSAKTAIMFTSGCRSLSQLPGHTCSSWPPLNNSGLLLLAYQLLQLASFRRKTKQNYRLYIRQSAMQSFRCTTLIDTAFHLSVIS